MAGLTKEQIAAKKAADKATKEAEVKVAKEAAEKKATAKKAAEESTVVQGGAITMKASEYAQYSKDNGRIMGREKGQKNPLSSQALRVYLNMGMKPSAIMERHGITEKELQGVVWQLSEEELRGKAPIILNIEADAFQKIR